MIPRVAQSFQSLRNSCALSAAGKPLWRAWTRQGGLPAASRGIHVDCPPIIPTLTSSYVHGTSSTPLQAATVAETLLKSVELHPDKEAMVFKEDGLRKTFAEFYQDVDRAAAGLLALGLKKGDRLGMWGPNTYEWVLFQFATAKAGIILVSVNPAYQLQEVEFALKKVGVKAIVCPTQFKTQKYCDMLRKICPEIEKASPGDIKSARLPDLRSVIVLDSRQPGMFHLEDVMQAGSSQYVQQLQDLQKTLQFDDPINIQFTSGTTGTPKGATLTHHNIVNNAYFVGRRIGYHWRPNTRICVPVPLYHCFGSVGAAMSMAVHGITLVFPSTGYDGRANLVALDSERCTIIYGTPTMYVDMLNQPDFDKFNLSSVISGFVAGSPVPPELAKTIVTKMGVKEITVEMHKLHLGGYGWSPSTCKPNQKIRSRKERLCCLFKDFSLSFSLLCSCLLCMYQIYTTLQTQICLETAHRRDADHKSIQTQRFTGYYSNKMLFSFCQSVNSSLFVCPVQLCSLLIPLKYVYKLSDFDCFGDFQVFL